MPRYKPCDYRQSLMVPLKLEDQLSDGSLEHALHHLIEDRIDESWFDELYTNDETGRPAYSPKLLLKIILLGYARGLIGSRRLELACKENVTFMGEAPLTARHDGKHGTVGGVLFGDRPTAGATQSSDRNRPARTRTPGGVGPVAG